MNKRIHLAVALFGVFICAGCRSIAPAVQTLRTEGKSLAVPREPDGFSFAIFGDRTGGDRTEGANVWRQTVDCANRLRPDFVFTVGDFIYGYGGRQEWLDEKTEFLQMTQPLKMPWYPVAGNHDIYWQQDTEERPPMHHESDYETYFGPLWYAFEYKNCWFAALFSDEGDPASGMKGYADPALQRMSDEQFAWLEKLLKKAEKADHVFVFLHHPRWTAGGYGGDWDKVHEAFVRAGNVSAVFAGHFHKSSCRQKYGIDYYVLGTTGGVIPEDSDLKQHLFYWVSVDGGEYSLTGVPVNALIISDARLAGQP